MSCSKSVFNTDWIDSHINPDFSGWIAAVPKNPFAAYCKLCKRIFSLSNMGKQAVTSHAKNKKHKKRTSQSTSMFDFVSKESVKKEDNTLVSSETSAVPKESVKKENNSLIFSETLACVINENKKCLSHFVMQENTFKAEILWAMKLVASHSSFNSFNDVSEIFCHMFPDSDIAKKCTLGRTKALEKQRQSQIKEKEKETSKRKVSQQIKLLQNKKMKLITEKSVEVAEIDAQISELSKKNN